MDRKIWIAISTPFQANFFHPLIKRLKGEFDFLITARDHDRIFSMLEAKGLDYVPVGKHGGRDLDGRLKAYAETVRELVPIIKKEKPAVLLTERWPEAVRVAFGLDIPAWTIYYDEREYHVNQMVFPLSSRVFAPRCYNIMDMRSNGVKPETIVWFKGFHTGYLKGQQVEGENPLREQGCEPPIILARPEPEFATFFNEKKDILEKTIHWLTNDGASKEDFNIVVFPRTEGQHRTYERYPVTIIGDAVACNPVYYADLTLGAAETMLMESFILGKPAVSTVYWRESKPLAELHRYIPHTTDPKEAASLTLQFLDDEKRDEFQSHARSIVDQMENPIEKMVEELRGLFNPPDKKCAQRSRRSKMEIYANILDKLATQPLKLTHVMQTANLSYSKAKRDLQWLVNRGLIEKRVDLVGNKCFKITNEGQSVLLSYKEVEERLL